MSYSEDLRERVVSFANTGGSKSEAARRFGVSRWCVYDWLNRDTLTPQKTGALRPWKLSPERLQEHVSSSPDAYHTERAQALGVSEYAIRYGLKRLGITRKKNGLVRRAKAGRAGSLPPNSGDDLS